MQKEKDPELRGEALLALAGRLERSKRWSSAAQIYSELRQSASEVSDRARDRLDAMAGTGSFGAQTELALGQLIDGIADPTALTAMAAAGAAYRVVRLATLGRLITAPGAGLLTRGLGARTLASSMAFAAEGAVFPAVHGLAAGASVPESHAAGFGEQVLSSYCVLGGLRLAALTARGLTGGLAAGLGSKLLQQGTLLGGILLGSGLERSLGLKAEIPWSSTLAQALTTLLHFNAASSLFRSLSGRKFQAWEKGVDLRIQNLESGLPATSWAVPGLGVPRPAVASGEGLVWKMADGEKTDKPLLPGQLSQAAASGKAPVSAPVDSKVPVSAPAAKVGGHEEVLEFFGTLEVSTDLLKRQSPIITALGQGNLRLRITQSNSGWPSGFLAHLAKSVQFHLARRGLLVGSGQTLTVELCGGGKTHQVIRLNKVAGEYVLAGDSKPPPSREPGESPFVAAANLLKTAPQGKAKPEVKANSGARKAENPPQPPENSWQRFVRELRVEVSYIQQNRGQGQARLILRENYPSDFFERREGEIGKSLYERSNHIMVPLGFKVILQIGEGEGARELAYIKTVGGYRKENPRTKR